MSNNDLTVDVPQDSENLPPDTNPKRVTVVVTEENGYIVKPGGDINAPRIEFKDVKPELDAAMAESGELILRIEGHRHADYEAVFKVMAYADNMAWKPSLAYK